MTTNESKNIRPDSSWTLSQLEVYALARASEICAFGRKTITHTWMFGESLSLIQEIKKDGGEWMAWVKASPFSHGTANNAIKLYERIRFEDLESCEDMTSTDLKVMLGIIKRPPVAKKQQPTLTPEQVADAATLPFPSVDGDTPQTADPTDRHVTVTDYARSPRKTPEPVVGPDLTPAERLGQVLNLIADVETSGVTADCSDLLAEIEAKVATLRQTLAVAATA